MRLKEVESVEDNRTAPNRTPFDHSLDAPLPRFEGLTSPAQSESPVVSSATLVTSHLTGSEPSVTNEDRTKYGGMFMACGPNSGLLDGDKAREVFLKSKLPVDKLSQIW